MHVNTGAIDLFMVTTVLLYGSTNWHSLGKYGILTAFFLIYSIYRGSCPPTKTLQNFINMPCSRTVKGYIKPSELIKIDFSGFKLFIDCTNYARINDFFKNFECLIYLKQYLFYLLYTLVHLKNPIYVWNEDSGMNYDTSKWFLLFICIPNSYSVGIIIPRESIHLFLFMLCLSAKNLPVFAPCVEWTGTYHFG